MPRKLSNEWETDLDREFAEVWNRVTSKPESQEQQIEENLEGPYLEGLFRYMFRSDRAPT